MKRNDDVDDRLDPGMDWSHHRAEGRGFTLALVWGISLSYPGHGVSLLLYNRV